MPTHREKIIGKLERGGHEDYKSLSISAIRRQTLSKTMYQVHCEHFKNKFSELYDDMDKAIDKFFEIKKRLR